MYIECSDNNGRPYLKLMRSYSYVDDDGIRRKGKDQIASIGFLDKFDDGKPDYMGRLRDSFRHGKPLIDSLNKYVANAKEESPTVHTIKIVDGTPDCTQNTYLYSHKFIERFLEEMRIFGLTRTYKNYDGITYDVYGFMKLLICGRILHPASKIETTRQNNLYYDRMMKHDFDAYDVYDTLSFLNTHKKVFFNNMNQVIGRQYPRSKSMICYDVTNFYFETEYPSGEDDIRQNGVSKEKRHQPIVQLGLFADANGIPLGYGLFKGNTLDHQTFKEALKDNIDQLPSDRFVMVGDRGMFSYKNVLNILKCGNGYIVSRSVMKSDKETKEWMFSDEGYTHLSDRFKYKSRITRRKQTDDEGNVHEVLEKNVVYWSKNIYDRCMAENKSYLDMLKRLGQPDGTIRVSAPVTKLLKSIIGRGNCVDLKTGQILDTKDLAPLIDQDKVDAYVRTFGYYQLVTSEVDLSDRDVIEKYHGLTQIEDIFRVMKGTLELRPAYVRTEDHLNGHVIVCIIALTIIRLIQLRVRDHEKEKNPNPSPEDELLWTYGISANRVVAALGKWKVGTEAGGLYKFSDIDDKDLVRILEAFNIEIPLKMYKRMDLLNLKTSMKIFDYREDVETEKDTDEEDSGPEITN